MKSFCTLALCFGAIQAFPQGRTQITPPPAVTASFTEQFPKAEQTVWEMEGASEYEANFKDTGVQRSANYNTAGNWLETETGIQQKELPQAVRTAIAKDHADSKVIECGRVETKKNGTVYEVQMSKNGRTSEITFSAEGAMLGIKEGTDDKD